MCLNFRLTIHLLGGMLLFLGALLLTPLPFSLYYGDGQWLCFLVSSGLTLLSGGVLFRLFGRSDEFTLREGFAIVTFGWIVFTLFGGLPYLCSGVLTHPADAFLESMSGFTTVGATVLQDIEAVPKSVLFWRALTQWLGGMGIIVLGVAILPLLGVGGMQLFNAEAAGPITDRLTPRIQDTARILWQVYALLTGVGVLLLWLGEMDLFDAICHSFTAVATGGFSTRNGSMGAFGSYSQWVTIGLMFLGGVSFSLHYFALKGRVVKYWRSEECRLYAGTLVAAILIILLYSWQQNGTSSISVRDSIFTVTSILTTTGFATADYEGWPFMTHALLIALMLIGGCAGSTAGGLKQIRLLLVVKHALAQTLILIHPKLIKSIRLEREAVSRDIVHGILGFTVLFFGTAWIGFVLVAASGVDLVTAGSAVIACITTVGPGLGEVGPFDNYAALPTFSKLVLTGCMLLGRLEVSTALVLLYPSFWKR